MNQSTTFLTLLKQIITQEDIQQILEKHEYVDTARKFTVSALLHFFIMSAANQRKSFRHGSDVVQAYGLASCDYSTVSKKASEVPL